MTQIQKAQQAAAIEAGQRYINQGTGRIVRVTAVEETSVRFHTVEDETYPLVESLALFANDFRKAS